SPTRGDQFLLCAVECHSRPVLTLPEQFPDLPKCKCSCYAQKHNFFLSLFQCMHPVEQLHFLFGAYHDLFRGIPVSNESLVKRMICMLFPFLQLLMPDMLCDLAEPCR